MHRIALVIGLGALLFASGSSAEDRGAPLHDPREALAATDKNGDGFIDREEFHHRMVDVFYFADRDRSGACAPGELEVYDADTIYARGDRDGDGNLSMYEFINVRFGDFERADVDDDGMLSLQEVVDEMEN